MKYKDLRMTIIFVILFLISVGLTIFSAINHNKARIIIGLIFSFISLITLLTRYNSKVFDDAVIIYVYVIIGIVPKLLSFDEIKEIKLISKHRVKIIGNRSYLLYLVNATAFYEDLSEAYKLYKG